MISDAKNKHFLSGNSGEHNDERDDLDGDGESEDSESVRTFNSRRSEFFSSQIDSESQNSDNSLLKIALSLSSLNNS
jgi:hypothetical protein